MVWHLLHSFRPDFLFAQLWKLWSRRFMDLGGNSKYYTPENLTAGTPKMKDSMKVWKMIFIFKQVIFGFLSRLIFHIFPCSSKSGSLPFILPNSCWPVSMCLQQTLCSQECSSLHNPSLHRPHCWPECTPCFDESCELLMEDCWVGVLHTTKGSQNSWLTEFATSKGTNSKVHRLQ